MDINHPLKYSIVGQLFEENYAWLRSRLRRRLRCRDHAEDVASETFSRVLVHPDPAAIREPRALLTTIAQRVLYESWRRRDLERAYVQSMQNQPEGNQCSPEEQTLVLEALLSIDRMLDGLPGQGKATFIYSQIGGLTYAEIAEKLGLSVSRVQQYMTEAFRLCLKAVP